MSETTLIQILTEQVELSKQILEELKKQSEWRLQGLDYKPFHAAEHLLTDKVVEQETKDTNTQVMRPIEDWLNELPEPIRTKALDSVDKESNYYNLVFGRVCGIEDALVYRNWSDSNTIEGLEYWENICEQLSAGTPPSELVDPVHLDKSRQ